jgi:hypothetical protein
MTTFQQLSLLASQQLGVKPELKKLIENSWIKLELRIPKPLGLGELLSLTKEAIDDAKHFSSTGDQEYFDELVTRDLAS